MNGDIHIVSTWLAENEMTLGLLNNDGIDYGKKRVSLKQRMLCAIYDQKYLESLLEQMWRQSRTEPNRVAPPQFLIPHSSFLIPHSSFNNCYFSPDIVRRTKRVLCPRHPINVH